MTGDPSRVANLCWKGAGQKPIIRLFLGLGTLFGNGRD